MRGGTEPAGDLSRWSDLSHHRALQHDHTVQHREPSHSATHITPTKTNPLNLTIAAAA